MEEFGLTVETKDPTGKLFEPVDPRTGNKMPARPLMPDPGWSHNPAKAGWQPDLGKYRPEIKKKLAPSQINTRANIEQAVRDKLAPIFKQGFESIQYTRASSYFMQTDSARGKIWISSSTWWPYDNFCPSKDLLNGLKALGQGKVPTFNQEAAIEMLWHEIGHNKQMRTSVSRGFQRNFMEVINQWVARWTYPEMVERMGFDTKLLKNHKAIIERNYGYRTFVANFRKLIQQVGLKEEELVEAMRGINETAERWAFYDHVKKLLAEKSGLSTAKVGEMLDRIDWSAAEFDKVLTKVLQ